MAQELQTVDSIFDYFYIDRSRLNYWLAQLDSDGVLASLKKSQGSSEGTKTDLGLNVAVKANQQSSDINTENHERTYDSQWTTPLLLLDLLQKNSLINRDITKAGLGSLVLLSGTIQMFDMTTLKNSFDAIHGLMFGDIPKKNRNQPKRVEKPSEDAVFMKRAGDLFKSMPSTPQIYMKDRTQEVVWSCLEEEHLCMNPSSMALSNGAFLNGEWHILGIVDGHRDDNLLQSNQPIASNELSDSIVEMLNAIRQMLGRPSNAHSVTPILVFRSVGNS